MKMTLRGTWFALAGVTYASGMACLWYFTSGLAPAYLIATSVLITLATAGLIWLLLKRERHLYDELPVIVDINPVNTQVKYPAPRTLDVPFFEAESRNTGKIQPRRAKAPNATDLSELTEKVDRLVEVVEQLISEAQNDKTVDFQFDSSGAKATASEAPPRVGFNSGKSKTIQLEKLPLEDNSRPRSFINELTRTLGRRRDIRPTETCGSCGGPLSFRGICRSALAGYCTPLSD